MRQRGFTLLELCYVLAIIAMLAAITAPVYDVLLRRSYAAESRAVLHAIAHAELQHFRDRGSYVACGPFGEVPDGTAAFPAAEACWKALGIRTDGAVRYRYGVTLTEGGFEVTAEGDLDGDGETSRLTLSSQDLHLEIVDELE